MPVLLHNVVSNFLETDAVCITMFFAVHPIFVKPQYGNQQQHYTDIMGKFLESKFLGLPRILVYHSKYQESAKNVTSTHFS